MKAALVALLIWLGLASGVACAQVGAGCGKDVCNTPGRPYFNPNNGNPRCCEHGPDVGAFTNCKPTTVPILTGGGYDTHGSGYCNAGSSCVEGVSPDGSDDHCSATCPEGLTQMCYGGNCVCRNREQSNFCNENPGSSPIGGAFSSQVTGNQMQCHSDCGSGSHAAKWTNAGGVTEYYCSGGSGSPLNDNCAETVGVAIAALGAGVATVGACSPHPVSPATCAIGVSISAHLLGGAGISGAQCVGGSSGTSHSGQNGEPVPGPLNVTLGSGAGPGHGGPQGAGEHTPGGNPGGPSAPADTTGSDADCRGFKCEPIGDGWAPDPENPGGWKDLEGNSISPDGIATTHDPSDFNAGTVISPTGDGGFTATDVVTHPDGSWTASSTDYDAGGAVTGTATSSGTVSGGGSSTSGGSTSGGTSGGTSGAASSGGGWFGTTSGGGSTSGGSTSGTSGGTSGSTSGDTSGGTSGTSGGSTSGSSTSGGSSGTSGSLVGLCGSLACEETLALLVARNSVGDAGAYTGSLAEWFTDAMDSTAALSIDDFPVIGGAIEGLNEYIEGDQGLFSFINDLFTDGTGNPIDHPAVRALEAVGNGLGVCAPLDIAIEYPSILGQGVVNIESDICDTYGDLIHSAFMFLFSVMFAFALWDLAVGERSPN